MTDPNAEEHLEPGDVASYVDRRVDSTTRQRIDRHLATCAECRDEIVAVSHIVQTLPSASFLRRPVWFVGAAAGVAAAAAMLLWVAVDRPSSPPPVLRDETITAIAAPRPISPIGQSRSVRRLTFSSVPSVASYRVRLFAADGALIWQVESQDTVIALPDSVRLRGGSPYYWKVEAHAGYGRSASSELTLFQPAFNGLP